MTRKNTNLPPRVYLNHGSYFYVTKPERKWIKLGNDFATAMREYGRLPEFSTRTTAEVFQRYRQEILPQKRESTQKKEKQYLNRLELIFAGAPPGSIRPVHIYQYLDRRPKVTGNRELSVLSDVMSYAIRWGVIEENPCKVVKRNPEKPRRRYVTDDEFWSVWDLASPIVQLAMELDLMLGLRPGDLFQLTRHQLTDRGIEVGTSKTGEKLIFEWTHELFDVVERAKRVRKVGSMYLLPTHQGRAYTVDGFRQLWRRVMLKFEARGGTRFQFRDLRAKSGSDHQSGEHLGHRDKRTLDRVFRRKPRAVRPLKIRK